RPGGAHDRVIGMVEPPGDLAENVLLGIPHAALLNVAGEVRRGAAGGGAVDAVVEGHEVFGERAAARDAGAAVLALDNVGPALQVVEGPHAVPGAVGGGILADENAAGADVAVLGGREAIARRAVGVEHLKALALADGIVAEHRDAVPGGEDAGELVRARS